MAFGVSLFNHPTSRPACRSARSLVAELLRHRARAETAGQAQVAKELTKRGFDVVDVQRAGGV